MGNLVLQQFVTLFLLCTGRGLLITKNSTNTKDASAAMNSSINFSGSLISVPSQCYWHDIVHNEEQAAPSPKDVISSPCQCDPLTRSCSTVIHWSESAQNGVQPVKRYRIILLKHWRILDEFLKCCQISNTTHSFNYTFTSGDVNEKGNIYFLLGAEPIFLNSGIHYYSVNCQPKITIDPKFLNIPEVVEGASHRFIFNFTGSHHGAVRWTHNQSEIYNNHTRYTIDNSEYEAEKGKMYTSLTIKKVFQEDVGYFECHVDNFFNDRSDLSASSKGFIFKVRKPEPKQIKGLDYIITVSLFSLVLLSSAAVYGFRKYQLRRHTLARQKHLNESRTHTVYISHCSQGEQKKKDILKFACYLETSLSNIAVVVDLTRQVEINDSGGIAQWIPKRMSDAYKILVVLSKEYLEALKFEENSNVDVVVNDQSSKVRAEHHFIENHLYQNFNVSNKLIVAWEDEDKEDGEVPPTFAGRKAYKIPKKKASFEEKSFLELFTITNDDDTSV